MESIVNQIEVKIKKKGRGNLFFARDFAALGTGDAIRKALQRIEKSGLLFGLLMAFIVIQNSTHLNLLTTNTVYLP